MMVWRELLQAVIEMVYPSRLQCPLCGAGRTEESLCPDCRQLLLGYAGERVCDICGCFAGTASGRDKFICPACRGEARPFELARSVAPFEGPVREAVHRLKYRGMQPLARPLGQLMAEAARRETAFSLGEALVPVPLHPRRERQRGYNQAALLARALGEMLSLPVLEYAIVKIKETLSQTALSGQQRRQNLQQSFAVAQPGDIKGKIIIVVDDVFTTGSTISNISHILRQSGAAGVQALTLAGTRQNGKK